LRATIDEGEDNKTVKIILSRARPIKKKNMQTSSSGVEWRVWVVWKFSALNIRGIIVGS